LGKNNIAVITELFAGFEIDNGETENAIDGLVEGGDTSKEFVAKERSGCGSLGEKRGG